MSHKHIHHTPSLPKPQATESAYDRVLNRQLFHILSDIAYILNNETTKAEATTVAGETNLMVYDVSNATLERVTVGAADSGGAGFKALRIPN